MLNKFRRKSRKKYQYGGKVPINMPMPKVTHGTTQDALKANVSDQEKANEEQLELNKAGGGDIVVPQLGHAAGDAGNNEIAKQLKTLNQGSADTEFDKQVPTVPKKKIGSFSDGYKGGKRRRKTKKRRTRKKQGGHCSKQLKKVKKLLIKTRNNKTRKNIKKLKKQMKILTKKIKEYDNPRKRLKKNKSHINRYKKLKNKFNRLL